MVRTAQAWGAALHSSRGKAAGFALGPRFVTGCVLLISTPLIGATTPLSVVLTPEIFGAVGNGVADDTEAWQRAVQDGRPIEANGRYLVSDTIELTHVGARVRGSGTLIAARSMADKSLLKSSADDCSIVGLTFLNPTEAQTSIGSRNIAIEIAADRCEVLNNRIDRFQNGIVVSSAGEFFDTLIQGNNVSNVIGSGEGAHTAGSGLGEDRGDGIVSWGSRTKILNNRVTAKAGTDARIGIHVEGLPSYKVRPASEDDDAGAEIRNNRVSGPFRRGIANEAVRDVVIEGNDLPGGYTWWGVAVTQGASNTIVRNNRVIFDRSTVNKAGASWSPWYSAIHIAAYGTFDASFVGPVTVENNEVQVTAGGGYGILYFNGGGDAQRLEPAVIRNNRILYVGGPLYPAVSVEGGARLTHDSVNNRLVRR